VTKEDIKRIELQADVSFANGQIIGTKVKQAIKRSSIFIFVIGASIVASVLFFVYGFLDHKHKPTL